MLKRKGPETREASLTLNCGSLTGKLDVVVTADDARWIT